jgi:hypothetical protein
LEFGVDIVLHFHDRLLPVLLPELSVVVISLDFAHLVEGVYAVDRQVVQLLKVLLDFGLREHVVGSEAHGRKA